MMLVSWVGKTFAYISFLSMHVLLCAATAFTLIRRHLIQFKVLPKVRKSDLVRLSL